MQGPHTPFHELPTVAVGRLIANEYLRSSETFIDWRPCWQQRKVIGIYPVTQSATNRQMGRRGGLNWPTVDRPRRRHAMALIARPFQHLLSWVERATQRSNANAVSETFGLSQNIRRFKGLFPLAWFAVQHTCWTANSYGKSTTCCLQIRCLKWFAVQHL